MNCSQCGYELIKAPFGNYVCPNNAIHAREDTKAILAHQLAELVEEFCQENDSYYFTRGESIDQKIENEPIRKLADFARWLKEQK